MRKQKAIWKKTKEQKTAIIQFFAFLVRICDFRL